jgi:integrase
MDGPISRKRITHEIEVMLARMKADGVDFPYFTLHTTRHTFATRCIEAGMQPQILKTILGHATLSMTMDLYSHVLPDVKQEAMEAVSGAF